MNITQRAQAFWTWFTAHAEEIRQAEPDDQIWNDLSDQIEKMDLTDWEFGALDEAHFYLALSPSGDPGKVHDAKRAVSLAPKLPGWRFMPFKPRKAWRRIFEYPGTGVTIDATPWRFSLHRQNDGTYELTYAGPHIPGIGGDHLIDALILGVETEIGEELFISKVCRISPPAMNDNSLTTDTYLLSELFDQLRKTD